MAPGAFNRCRRELPAAKGVDGRVQDCMPHTTVQQRIRTATGARNQDILLVRYAVFKGPATLYVLRMTPDGVACVLTSSNERAGVPSAKKRFPVPNKTGETISTTSSARPCSSTIDVNVEVPERMRSRPSCDVIWRTPATMSGPSEARGAAETCPLRRQRLT